MLQDRKLTRIPVMLRRPANWFRSRMDLRPFDVVTGLRGRLLLQGWDISITDPMRVGRLLAGTDYFKKGAAAAQILHTIGS